MTRRIRWRRTRGLLRVLALAALALVALPSVAGAHAFVVSSSPSAGARLSRPPARLEATFSEPVDGPLSRLTLETAGGGSIATKRLSAGATKVAIEPLHRLGRGVYRVRWHSVSADDGHTVNGAYAFSVAAPLTAQDIRAPSASSVTGGWFAFLLRVAFDALLISFCGGIFCDAVLSVPGSPGGWLVASGRRDDHAVRSWRVTVALGFGAVALSAVVAGTEAARAGDGLTLQSLGAYVTADMAGYMRVALTVALLVSVLLTVHRRTRRAAVCAIAGLVALVVGGHARSANAPAVAITADVVHLAGASVWIGGIVHLVLSRLMRLREVNAAQRRAALEVVLPRFGRLALPAFALALAGGAGTAASELPSLSSLWTETYGRVLVVKTTLVVAIAAMSYVHAFRLRPKLITSSVDGSSVERRHWRLLGLEPPVAAGVIIAAAWLVSSGAPARTTTGSATQRRNTATEGLSVAAQAGPYIVNALVTQGGGTVAVKLRTLDALERPVAVPGHVAGRTRTHNCGTGCIEVYLMHPRPVLTVGVRAHGRTYSATLPIRSAPASARFASRLLSAVARSTRHLGSVAIRETLGSGDGPIDVTQYRVQAPDRLAYRLARAGQVVSDTVIVGTRQWTRQARARTWKVGRYGGDGAHFSTGAYLEWWTPYALHPRLLSLAATGGVQQADVATSAAVAGLGTVWLRLRLDVTHRRVQQIRMVTVEHFMTQAWTRVDARMNVQPPARSR